MSVYALRHSSRHPEIDREGRSRSQPVAESSDVIENPITEAPIAVVAQTETEAPIPFFGSPPIVVSTHVILSATPSAHYIPRTGRRRHNQLQPTLNGNEAVTDASFSSSASSARSPEVAAPVKTAKPKPIYEVDRILKKKGSGRRTRYLVKWVGYADKTWEPESNFMPANEALLRFKARMKKKDKLKAEQRKQERLSLWNKEGEKRKSREPEEGIAPTNHGIPPALEEPASDDSGRTLSISEMRDEPRQPPEKRMKKSRTGPCLLQSASAPQSPQPRFPPTTPTETPRLRPRRKGLSALTPLAIASTSVAEKVVIVLGESQREPAVRLTSVAKAFSGDFISPVPYPEAAMPFEADHTYVTRFQPRVEEFVFPKDPVSKTAPVQEALLVQETQPAQQAPSLPQEMQSVNENPGSPEVPELPRRNLSAAEPPRICLAAEESLPPEYVATAQTEKTLQQQAAHYAGAGPKPAEESFLETFPDMHDIQKSTAESLPISTSISPEIPEASAAKTSVLASILAVPTPPETPDPQPSTSAAPSFTPRLPFPARSSVRPPNRVVPIRTSLGIRTAAPPVQRASAIRSSVPHPFENGIRKAKPTREIGTSTRHDNSVSKDYIRVVREGSSSGLDTGAMVVGIAGFKPREQGIRGLTDLSFLVTYADHESEFLDYQECIRKIPHQVAEFLSRNRICDLENSPMRFGA